MPNGYPRCSAPSPEERLRTAADMLDSLAGLIGQADDINVCGRDGIAALLDLLAEQIEDATCALTPRPAT